MRKKKKQVESRPLLRDEGIGNEVVVCDVTARVRCLFNISVLLYGAIHDLRDR